MMDGGFGRVIDHCLVIAKVRERLSKLDTAAIQHGEI